MVYDVNLLTVLVMAALGAVAAYLSNQNVAVFNDGTRPMYGPYIDKKTDRKTLFATSFALSFGLVIGFGLPTSIAGGIIIVHTILLACDIIGVAFSDSKKGMILATASGAVFGVLLMFGMQTIINLFSVLPINFLGNLSTVGSLVITLFCIFPALAIAYQSGFKSGIIVFVMIMIVKQVFTLFGKFTINNITIALNADGMALLFGILAMVVVAARSGKKGDGSTAEVFKVFENNISRIKKNMFVLAVSGGIVALATSLLLIAEGPASLTLMAQGNYGEAAIVALGRCIGFIPLVMTTAIISGVYSPCGTKAVHIPAILLINLGIMGLVGSFFIGSLIMVIEVLLLGFIAKGMDKYPGMKELGDNTRTAMSKILDIALLVGGMIAANAIAPSIGYIWVAGLYFLNQTAKKPIPAMAIGPVGAITLGLIVNILHIIGMFPIIK
ncbi:MAG: YhfT family protein [Erysipelotrichaceae bacterium]